jgi:hypothetical protein
MKLKEQYGATVTEAAGIAREEGFAHVGSLLRRLLSDEPYTLSELDQDQMRAFARFIRLRSMLLHPYWDDSREPYVEAHEEEHLELMNGFYGLLAGFMLDELQLPVEP